MDQAGELEIQTRQVLKLAADASPLERSLSSARPVFADVCGVGMNERKVDEETNLLSY
jgi:hypothetical protein